MIIGLVLRHYKVYNGINYIPLSFNNNFVSYVGENGSGKSSVLEGLDTYFNSRRWLVNNTARSKGVHDVTRAPYILPLFLIEKSKVSNKKYKKIFEELSSFFWDVDIKALNNALHPTFKPFFDQRKLLEEKRETHYLFFLGEALENLYNNNTKISFGSFESKFNEHFKIKKDRKGNKDYSKFEAILKFVKRFYSYLYIPVESDIKDFTKLTSANMEKLFGKKIKDEIKKTLDGIDCDEINSELEKFVKDIEDTLEGNYSYGKGDSGKQRLTPLDLAEKILEVYFQIRILMKKSKSGERPRTIGDLSAGEKRQALINLVYAFMKKENERDRELIIAIDEPENSLHNSLCYEQFEKLKEISLNNQILITTHWYGFLPILSEGMAHFLFNKEDKVEFESYDLYNYRDKIRQDSTNPENKGRVPHNYALKSAFDLIQSIFHSLRCDPYYNWIICEGVSEKVYFNYFFQKEIKDKKLKLLSVGGQPSVREIYEYLIIPMKKEKDPPEGKVYCLMDTDIQDCKISEDSGKPNLQIKRLSNIGSKETDLNKVNDNHKHPTAIENSLNPKIFRETLIALEAEGKYLVNNLIYKGEEHFDLILKKLNFEIEEEVKNLVLEKSVLEKIKSGEDILIDESDIKFNIGNTCFDISLDNKRYLEGFFKKNKGENKIKFAEKYVEIMNKKEDPEKFIPNWVGEIKSFFK